MANSMLVIVKTSRNKTKDHQERKKSTAKFRPVKLV